MVKKYTWLDKLKQKSLAGEMFTRAEFISLLSIELESDEFYALGNAAREVAKEVTGNKARIWAAVGVDYVPCPVNCSFCSFGEKWGIVKEPYAWSDDEVVRMARHFISQGAKYITLRTTEMFPPDKLVELSRRIHENLVGDYHIVVNTGEFDQWTAEYFKANGIDVIYHSLRLREGDQTGITPAHRLCTLQAVQGSPLSLAFLVEPVGVEHSNEEIADIFFTSLQYGAVLGGIMARVPVPGTPLGDAYPALDIRRVAQLIAAVRLAGGRLMPDICVHPPTKLAMNFGANICVVESGAVPRAADHLTSEWQVFTVEEAKAWFVECGYEIDGRIA